MIARVSKRTTKAVPSHRTPKAVAIFLYDGRNDDQRPTRASSRKGLNHEAITCIDRRRLCAFGAGGRRAVRPTAAETINARTTGATRSHQAGSPAHDGSAEDHFTATGSQSQ